MAHVTFNPTVRIRTVPRKPRDTDHGAIARNMQEARAVGGTEYLLALEERFRVEVPVSDNCECSWHERAKRTAAAVAVAQMKCPANTYLVQLGGITKTVCALCYIIIRQPDRFCSDDCHVPARTPDNFACPMPSGAIVCRDCGRAL